MFVYCIYLFKISNGLWKHKVSDKDKCALIDQKCTIACTHTHIKFRHDQVPLNEHHLHEIIEKQYCFIKMFWSVFTNVLKEFTPQLGHEKKLNQVLEQILGTIHHLWLFPDWTVDSEMKFTVHYRGSHVDSSASHFITWALFSVTHLMFAVVFSRACSNAKVPEPKPTWAFSSLNCFSCRVPRKKERLLGVSNWDLLYKLKLMTLRNVLQPTWFLLDSLLYTYLLELKLCWESPCYATDKIREGKWSSSISDTYTEREINFKGEGHTF